MYYAEARYVEAEQAARDAMESAVQVSESRDAHTRTHTHRPVAFALRKKGSSPQRS